MAKYEIKVYDPATGEVEKILQKNFMPSSLFIKYQKFVENVDEKKDDDTKFFSDLNELIVETFPELTAEECEEKTDVAEKYALLQRILTKAMILKDESKNA